MSTQDTTLPPLPHPLLIAGGKNWFTIEQMHAYARAAIAAQAPQPSPLVAVGEDGEGQENHCPECGAEPGQMCSDEEGVEHGRKVHAVRQAQQAQGVPPRLAALKEKIAEAIKVSDDVGRSRGSNCYAQNTRAVVKICELQDSIARDLETLAAHDEAAAVRLRGICGDLGLGSAIPETNEQLMGVQFSVFGMIRRALAKGVPLIAVGEDGEGQENHCHECGAEPGQMCSDEEGTEHGRKVHAVRQAQQAQGVPADFEQVAQALETAKNGLLWYQDRCKDAVDGSDDEAMEEIDLAIETCHQLAAAPQAERSEDTAALRRDLARAHDSANGFVEEIQRLKQLVRELEAFRAMVNRYQPEFPADPDGPRDVWYWQGDHMDHLESMVHTLPVVIRAEQLRELLASYAPQAEPSQASTYEPDPAHDNRYRVEQQGFWWWVIRAGDGTRTLFKAHTKISAMELAQELATAFRDGEFVGQTRTLAAPQAEPQPEREPFTADVECVTDESGTDYSVAVRGPGIRNPLYSDVWMKSGNQAKLLAKWLNEQVFPAVAGISPKGGGTK